MIAHAVHIVVNELNRHFQTVYAAPTLKVEEGNIAMGVNGSGIGNVPGDKIILTLVNYKEEKTLKNLPHYSRDNTTLKVTYENPPVYLNFLVLMTATHAQYKNALIDPSRVIRFFQSQSTFSPDSVAPASLIPDSADVDPIDHLESFKLLFELYSPSLEEVNHLWGTLGGKQYPFVMYLMRVLDLKFRVILGESGLITEVVSEFSHKNTN